MKWLILAVLLLLSGCAQAAPERPVATRYPDGVYRGTYYDYSTEQLAVEFEMKDQQFESIRFTGMRYRDGDYLQPGATQAQQAIVSQYQTAAGYLLQKGVDSLTDLYKSPELIPDVDAVTGATLKTSAVVSAIYDGLSHMPYCGEGNGAFIFDKPVCDGRYHGFFNEGGIERIAVSFELKEGFFESLKIRALKDGEGVDYKVTDGVYQVVRHCLTSLENKPLSALAELDGDASQMSYGDNRMVDGLRCAIFGGLSRGPYQSADAAPFFESLTVVDGTYRGHYYDKGIEKLSIQFEVENGRLYNISFRGKQEDLAENPQLERYKQACLALEGEPIAAVNSLYSLSDASFEAGELTYAIADALTRGLYKLSNASLLPAVQTAADGTWDGCFQSDGLFIKVELRLEQSHILSAKLTELKIDDADYGDEEGALLLDEQLAKLSGVPLVQINELYHWEHPLALPLVGALWDAIETE